jgi:hypothetical protein
VVRWSVEHTLYLDSKIVFTFHVHSIFARYGKYFSMSSGYNMATYNMGLTNNLDNSLRIKTVMADWRIKPSLIG